MTTSRPTGCVHRIVDERTDSEGPRSETTATVGQLGPNMLCHRRKIVHPEVQMVLEQVGPILYHVEKKEPTSLTGGRLIETKDPTPSCISLDIRRVKPKQSRKQNLFSTEDMARTRLEAIRESEGPFEIPQLLFVVESKELRYELLTQVGNLHVLLWIAGRGWWSCFGTRTRSFHCIASIVKTVNNFFFLELFNSKDQLSLRGIMLISLTTVVMRCNMRLNRTQLFGVIP